ncbi:outer membrane beta-barrel protein [Croceibacterium sp. LX-88]|uniref:Outer membrane beta-barrel protein n=1 Tax=Croceibacterium selenioxidans TaxID=2838833 RepID=A0ABS5VZP7_9SPHN|nr:TonB-dependent receptor [Croceibacterium selenioxidans]MBT2132993.1 outer membrane beta-barrel protein [Croceibacterium selenioxidans]
MRLWGHLSNGAAFTAIALAFTLPAQAQVADSADEDVSETSQPQTSSQIVVQADIGFRNRSEGAEPVLVYDEDYFQRFEPLTAGDALKRVPSVTFLSDVIESDGPRLRGLDPGYTQILINGERVPGPNPDRSFFLDRIPAELIEQVEIVRSSSARRTGDAVAGTINIKLRDALALDGGYIKGGGILFDDGELKPTLGLYYGGALGPGRVLVGANLQGRYNPKEKLSLRYSNDGENQPVFDNREDQSDIRDGTDYAFNGSYILESDTTTVEFSGNYVRTDRAETERSFEYNVISGTPGPVESEDDNNPGLLTDAHQLEDIDQENWAFAAKLAHEWSLGKTTFKANLARFDDNVDSTETELAFDTEEGDDPEWESKLTAQHNDDQELSFALDHEIPVSMDINFVVGGFLQDKDRDTNIAETKQKGGLDNRDWDQFTDSPVDLIGSFDDPEAEDLSSISEKRRDLYALFEGDHGVVSWEAGVRWESTRTRITDLIENAVVENDYDHFLPSASLKYDIGMGRFTLSGARTVRRPQFDYLTPAVLVEEIGDNDFQGNPLLLPEKAWGADFGYEHHLGRTGVIGVNVFYRKVEDLVELATVFDEDGVPVPGQEGGIVLQPQNVGSGEVYGIEFDLSADLGFIGLPNTGVFGNLSVLDSSVEDVFGERRFNDQSDLVYNFGVIQNLPKVGVAFGATYRKQGSAFGRVLTEEVTTTYGADLEIFVEKRVGDSFTIRAVGSNLLDGKKKEAFNKFDSIEDQVVRAFDEYELESERAGPVFQLVGRYAF